MSKQPAKASTGPAAAHIQPRSTLDTDGMLSEWGARLFYPALKGKGNGGNGGGPGPMRAAAAAATTAMSAQEVRSRMRSTVSPGATQVMVKITGGGRGMKAIAAHFRYIGRQGKEVVGGWGQTLEIEDERGEKIQGSLGLAQLADEWRVARGGCLHRRRKHQERGFQHHLFDACRNATPGSTRGHSGDRAGTV